MNRSIAAVALALFSTAPVLAFDAASQDVIDYMKQGKRVPIAMVADLMMGAEKWCYLQAESGCSWSDIYLAVHGNDVSFEISHGWNDTTDISFVSAGVLREGRFICEIGHDWLPSTRGYGSEDGFEVGGRHLAELKLEIEQWTNGAGASDCFDYVFQGADDTAQTIDLVQRQYVDGVTDSANDVTVTLHFDAATAEALGWY